MCDFYNAVVVIVSIIAVTIIFMKIKVFWDATILKDEVSVIL
jgi:hypothetical protein